MPMLLNVQSSPNLSGSGSRAVSQAYVEAYLDAYPDAEVVTLDLALEPPPHFNGAHQKAFFTPPEHRTAEDAQALVLSDHYIDMVMRADVILLGTPMHNFGIASTMKGWLDQIVRAGVTFRFSENGPVGLIPPGKKLVVVVGSGGIYSQGPFAAYEHAGNHLRDILATTGLTDCTILRAEGLAITPEIAAQGLANGKSAAAALAAS